MIKNFFLLAAAAVSFGHSPSALGHLDETTAQCDARYGRVKEVAPPFEEASFCDEMRKYEHDGLIIVVSIMHGQAAAITFMRLDARKFGDAEIKKLLEANRGKSAWSAPELRDGGDGSSITVWAFKDGRAALYTPLTKTPALTVMNKDFVDAQNAAEAARKTGSDR